MHNIAFQSEAHVDAFRADPADLSEKQRRTGIIGRLGRKPVYWYYHPVVPGAHTEYYWEIGASLEPDEDGY